MTDQWRLAIAVEQRAPAAAIWRRSKSTKPNYTVDGSSRLPMTSTADGSGGEVASVAAVITGFGPMAMLDEHVTACGIWPWSIGTAARWR